MVISFSWNLKFIRLPQIYSTPSLESGVTIDGLKIIMDSCTSTTTTTANAAGLRWPIMQWCDSLMLRQRMGKLFVPFLLHFYTLTNLLHSQHESDAPLTDSSCLPSLAGATMISSLVTLSLTEYRLPSLQ